MTLFRAVAGVLVIMAIVVGRAPAAWSEEQPRWQDTAELSFVQTGGNTDVTTIAAKNLLQYRLSDNWAMQWKTAALHAESDGEKTAERYETDLRTDYKGGERICCDGLAVRVAYELRYDNRPTPADLKNSDSLLTVSLVLNL